MNLATLCTVMLFTVISIGIQILNWWLLAKSMSDDGEWLLLIPIIIFLWNTIAPVVMVYKILAERGML